MKTLRFPLSLRIARASLRPALLTLPLLAGASIVQAQEGPRIVFPQEGQDVRGEISVRFNGIPAGGYAIIKVNGQFKTATSQGIYPLDTIADTTTFNGDGTYTLDITALNASGRTVGTSSVKFNVANNKVANQSEAVFLTHWVPGDRLNDGVQRYRVFAESNADIQESTGGGGGGGGLGGGGMSLAGGSGGGSKGGGGGAGASGGIAAPLDWQVSALLRREVRDVNGFSSSANIATLVSEAWEHQREGEGGGGGAGGAGDGLMSSGRGGGSGGGGGGGASTAAPGTKAGWAKEWTQGPEFAKFYVKAVQQTGDEINATRKANGIAIADLLPTFPPVQVRPGSTWNSRQSILSDLSTRKPINIEGAITFTAYENIQTPAGESRRCAKIESRFPLPDSVAKRIAADLGSKVGSTGGAGGGLSASGGSSSGGGPSAGGDAGGAAATLSPDDIKVASFNMARVIWFDMDRHQIVRSEDNLRAYFELPLADNGAGAAGGSSLGGPSLGRPGLGSSSGIGGDGGAAQAPAEPTKVNYTMNITTWLDDRIPNPTIKYTGGAGTAHGRDNVNEPGISRITRR